MKKTNFLYASAIMMAMAFGMQSCSIEDNPAPEPKDPIVEAIENGATLNELVASFAKDNTLALPAGATVELAEAITLDAPLTITADAEKPATIVAKAGFVTSKNFAIENVNIDASALESNLIALSAEEPAEVNNIDAITLNNVKVKGLSKSLFYSAAKKNLIADFNIKNSIVEVTGDVIVIDFTKGSSAVNVNVENSTLYATTTTTKSMYSSQSGQKLTELLADGVQTFKFANSTVYNFAKTKNFFSHRQSNQKWLAYDVQGCIFVDCGKSGQVIKGMNGGSSGTNPTWIIKGNVFNFDGADTSADESTGDDAEPVTESIAAVVAFADAANGDFTQSNANAGDPRWIK